MSKTRKGSQARLLLLVGDMYGLNCTSNERRLSILEKLRRFGWDLTLVGIDRVVQPCRFGQERGAPPLRVDCLVCEIEDVSSYDGISILPGPVHAGLIHSPEALALLRRAASAGLVLSSWCRGTRVLAAANVIRGKKVVGHPADQEAIEKAGGIYLGQDCPPVIDGRLVTGARSYAYRAKMAEAIRAAIRERAATLPR